MLINKIRIKGFVHPEGVTVQTKEDGLVTSCNHAGHGPGILVIGDDARGEAELCDKCDAWSYDGENWYE